MVLRLLTRTGLFDWFIKRVCKDFIAVCDFMGFKNHSKVLEYNIEGLIIDTLQLLRLIAWGLRVSWFRGRCVGSAKHIYIYNTYTHKYIYIYVCVYLRRNFKKAN